MYKKILVANRADCAVRLIRACHALGAEAVLIAARDDQCSVLKDMADDIIFTGMSRSAYTSQDDILEAALRFGCEAILPGWGFLSEEFSFARKARLAGIDFIGPSDQQLRIFGDKVETIRRLAPAFEVPHPIAVCDDLQFDEKVSSLLHAPYMLKPRFGGGGKNIRLFQSLSELQNHIHGLAKTDSLANWFVESAVVHSDARHIEFQFFGDGHGRIVCLGLRDCTHQVHHQKWLEYSVDIQKYPRLVGIKSRICEVLQSLKYQGWGTAECLLDENGGPHLLEVNPRLQVEHGVTELSSGVDIVRAAIELASSKKMPSAMMDLREQPLGDAVEFRLFARSAGIIEDIGFDGIQWPHHPFDDDETVFRVESAMMPGDEVSGVYDGLCARFLLRAHHEQSLAALGHYMASFRFVGLDNNLDDLYKVCGAGRIVR